MTDTTTSKTARASMPTRAATGFQNASELPLLISCGGGSHARVFDPRNGHSLLLATGSPEFADTLAAICNAGHAEKVEAELVELGWESARRAVGQRLAA